MVDKTLPENQAQAMAAVVDQAGRSGSEEAKAFTSALLEARAYLAPKVLPPPTQKAADPRALGVSLEKLHAATKERNELREKARLSEVAYESEVKKGYDIRTSIEETEEHLRILRQDLDASMAALVPLREEKDKDIQALGAVAHKLLALEGAMAAKDRPPAQKSVAQSQLPQDAIDPEKVLGQLCVGKRACLMPTLLQYFSQQFQMLEDDENEEDLDAPLPEGKFHAPSVTVQQVPATPVIGGIGTSAAITA